MVRKCSGRGHFRGMETLANQLLPNGRRAVFHDALGDAPSSMIDTGFQVTFAWGTEWAATGRDAAPDEAGELRYLKVKWTRH